MGIYDKVKIACGSEKIAIQNLEMRCNLNTWHLLLRESPTAEMD